MPPIGAAIAAYAASTFATMTIGTILTKVLVSLAISQLMSAIMPKPKQRSIGTVEDARGRTEMIREPTQARRIIYGETMVSGNIVFADSSGTENEFLSLVIALAGCECSSIQAVYFNDTLLTIASNVVTNTKYQSDGNPHAWVYEHLGAAGQAADAVLVANSGGRWTSLHRLDGITYLHCRFLYNADVWPDGIPKVRALVRGKKVYDPRDLSTAYSDNPPLCLRDYKVTYLEVAAADINDTTVSAAANVCDESVSLAAGGSESRYVMSGTVDLDQRPSQVIEAMLSSFAGTMTYTGGLFEIHAGAATTATVTLTEDDLSGGISVQTRLSRSEIFNAVKAVYVDPSEEYQATTAAPITNATYETADGGYQIVKQVDLPFTPSNPMAQRLAKIELERARQQMSASYPAKPSALALKIWDTINVTNTNFGWSAKKFRIVGWQLREDMGVNLTLREEADAMWSWSAEETILDPAPNTNLPDPFSVATPGGITITEALVVSASGGVSTRLTADVTAIPDIFVGEYELQYKKSTETLWIGAGRHDGTRFEIQGVEDEITYDIRASGINRIGVRSASWRQISYTPAGQVTPPEDVTNFAINFVASTAHLTWAAVTDIDLSHYRLRWSKKVTGASWGESIDLVPRVGRPATSIDTPSLIGTYLIKAVDMKGNESTNATLISSTIGSLAGLNVIQTETEDTAFSGAKSNVVAVDNILKLDTSTLFDDGVGNFDDGVGLFDGGDGTVAATGTYSFANTVDLGASYTSQITASIKITALDYANLFDAGVGNFDDGVGLFDGETPSQVNVKLQIRTTTDDPASSPVWSAWRDFVLGDYRARGLQFQAILSTLNAGVTPVVEELSITIDMPDRVVAADDISAAAGGEVVTFSPSYRVLEGISIAAQDLATGDYFVITSKTAAGFTIQFKNAAGAGVSRTFDYLAKGYGVAS